MIGVYHYIVITCLFCPSGSSGISIDYFFNLVMVKFMGFNIRISETGERRSRNRWMVIIASRVRNSTSMEELNARKSATPFNGVGQIRKATDNFFTIDGKLSDKTASVNSYIGCHNTNSSSPTAGLCIVIVNGSLVYRAIRVCMAFNGWGAGSTCS